MSGKQEKTGSNLVQPDFVSGLSVAGMLIMAKYHNRTNINA